MVANTIQIINPDSAVEALAQNDDVFSKRTGLLDQTCEALFRGDGFIASNRDWSFPGFKNPKRRRSATMPVIKLKEKQIMRTLAFIITLAVTALATQAADKPSIKFDNSYFYDANGKFLPEKAKDAVIALMKHHGCPVFKNTRDKLWVSDYGVGQYARLGLAAVIFVNNEKDRYMLLDAYLLPNQMLPEHWHIATDKNPGKMEGWLVRHGSARFVGEGEPNLSKEVVVPACHLNGSVTVKHETICGAGEFAQVNRPEAHHWIYAGPQGVIFTEVANVHDSSGVLHADKVLNDYFLKEYGGAK